MEAFVKGTGIVCEYNPFHNGHKYQIEKIKSMGASVVVCAMSGDFTQRGEPAFQDKHIRAENAVRNGADIVLEIPFPFSSMSAEGFAKSGISVLENSGLCDSFAFGSECADVEKLQKIADALTPAFHKEVIALQKNEPNLSYASAREKLVCRTLGNEFANILKNPNDILGIEYLKANKSLVPIAIKRQTPRGGYDDNFVSSSYIRNNLFCEETRTVATNGLPKENCLDGICKNESEFRHYMLVSLMQKTPLLLSDISEVPRGCEHSIIKNAIKAESFEELCGLLASKTLTDAKIRRMLLFSVFGVTKEMARSTPLYTEVLAASEKGHKMLKKYTDDRRIIVASRVAEIKKDKAAKEQYDFARLAAEVVDKCRKTPL